MSDSSGVSIEQIQLGMCQVGYQGRVKLSAAAREAACKEYEALTGINPRNDTDTKDAILLSGLIILPLLVCAVLGYIFYRRHRRKSTKSTNTKTY